MLAKFRRRLLAADSAELPWPGVESPGAESQFRYNIPHEAEQIEAAGDADSEEKAPAKRKARAARRANRGAWRICREIEMVVI